MASRGDEQYTSSEDEGVHTHRAKRRKGPKACDVCRRKKSDPDPSGDPHRSCVNCAVFKTECTYTYVAKKRRTQQAYIDGLQNRLSKVEKLLHALAPDIDISKVLDDDGEISHLLSSSHRHASGCQLPRPPSPPKQVPRPPPPGLNPGHVVAAFTEWRDSKSSDEEDDDGLAFFPVASSSPGGGVIHGHSNSGTLPHRFHGKSSGLVLIRKVIDMKRDHTGGVDSSAYAERLVVRPDPWEAKTKDLLPKIVFTFPPQDLLEHLIDVFFRCVNSFLPILHRPTFEASVRDGFHLRDPSFGAVVLLLCAAASRWSDDPRVLPQSLTDAEEQQPWSAAGWEFYFQVHARYRRNLLDTTTTSVLDLQMMALGCLYLQGTSTPSPSWQMAGLGLRLALDVGIHQRKRPESHCILENELWKRAFWVLVVIDRLASAALGRPCAIWEEDIDVDLPLEVDDEYFTTEAGFKQPPDKPPRMAYFNSYVKLTQILIGALRTIYPMSKAKSMCRLIGPGWEQDMVAALDSSLNNWIDNIPEHLRWDPNRNMDFYFHQSALLHCSYYYVQIVVHRPYISSSRKPSPLAFPSLAICTNAARSCSHIIDAQLRRGDLLIPMLNNAAFTSAIVLLFNIWGTNKPGARIDWQSQVHDVHICMRFIRRTEGRWGHAGKMWKLLLDLVSVGDFPLPASPPSHPSGGQKRARDSDDASDSAHPATPATSSSSTTDFSGNLASQSYAPDETRLPSSSEHAGFKQEPLGFTPYLQSVDTSNYVNFEQMSLPHHQCHVDAAASNPLLDATQNTYPIGQQQQQQPEQRTNEAHSAHDVLTALDAAYLVDGASSLGNGVVMNAAQQTFDVWGSAPSGFQWDEWQQITNIVQNAPDTGVSEGTGEQVYSWSQL